MNRGNDHTTGIGKGRPKAALMRQFSHACRVLCLIAGASLGGCITSPVGDTGEDGVVSIAIHGGAGTIPRGKLGAEREQAIHAALRNALQSGHERLLAGSSAREAVIAAILVLEDSPLFNAGKGAVFNADGVNELDAAIMDGRTRNAGAVAGVRRVKNPILLADAVMNDSPHVMMIGKGAEQFAEQRDIALVDPSYFHTDYRWQQLQKALQKDVALNHVQSDELRFGTVGAVALDRAGNLAAGTSTGGMTKKRFGRVGDVPIIGAGTYADNASCAVSATGHGEYFIRSVVAHDIAAMMSYKGVSVREASEQVVNVKLKEFGGGGGVIAIDAAGNISLVHNTSGMYRGSIDADGNVYTAIYAD